MVAGHGPLCRGFIVNASCEGGERDRTPLPESSGETPNDDVSAVAGAQALACPGTQQGVPVGVKALSTVRVLAHGDGGDGQPLVVACEWITHTVPSLGEGGTNSPVRAPSNRHIVILGPGFPPHPAYGEKNHGL